MAIFNESKVSIWVSVKMMRLPFEGCSEDYIRNVCHGRCCKVSGTGPIVLVEKDQVAALKARGALFLKDGTLKTEDKRCRHQELEGFCGLHGSDAKPRSCIQSPFKLTSRDTLIVKNRYRLLCCFKAAPALPAYRAFASSLALLFGQEVAEDIIYRLDGGQSKNFMAPMLRERYEWAKIVDKKWKSQPRRTK